MKLQASELILNPDGSIYHLHLLPEDIADTIILVGDQNRVSRVSNHFDAVDTQKEKREFITHTGSYRGKRISVISTGIGTDNIDIVLNELDALVNIDLKTREIKEEKTSLKFIRIRTSGALRPELEVDNYLVSAGGIGLDGLGKYYPESSAENAADWSVLKSQLNQFGFTIPYFAWGSQELLGALSDGMLQGITLCAAGFYGPQGRSIRLPAPAKEMIDHLMESEISGYPVTNLEMETAAIYLLADLLGHQALSLNALIANRSRGTFSKHPYETVDRLIKMTLDNIVDKPVRIED